MMAPVCLALARIVPRTSYLGHNAKAVRENNYSKRYFRCGKMLRVTAELLLCKDVLMFPATSRCIEPALRNCPLPPVADTYRKSILKREKGALASE